MKHAFPTASAFLAGAVALAAVLPSAAIGAEGDLDFSSVDLGRYSDAPFGNHSTDLSVSVLTEERVILGNDDGTFAPDRRLNRAEFVQIVMRLLNDTGTVNKNCFPDVSPSVWYADPVCRAKALGIVRGNARVGVEESLWRFEPTRDVQYEEAVKILVQVYALPVVGDTEGMDWYVPYIETADDMGLSIEGLSPGDRITRAEMARLTAAFVAESHGQLAEFRAAEEGSMSSSSSSRTSSSSSMSSSSSVSSSSSSYASDPNDDVTVRSNFLLLGEASPVLGAVNVFPAHEAINLDKVTVRFTNDSSAITNLRLYETDTGRYIGTAYRQSAGVYVANVPTGTLVMPQNENTGIYVRADLRDVESGGTGGQYVRIDSVTVEGTGEWSNDDYTIASNVTFQTFQVAPAAIVRVTSTGGLSSSLFQAGQDVVMGTFDFDAETSDARFTPRVTDLTFTIAASNGVTLSNAYLTLPGSSVTSPCTVSANRIECSSIPASIGTVDGSQSIRLVADVTGGGSQNPFLQVSLSDPGTPTSAGAVAWTDGTTAYGWIPGDTPVARGIRYE